MPEIFAALMDFFASGQPVLNPQAEAAAASGEQQLAEVGWGSDRSREEVGWGATNRRGGVGSNNPQRWGVMKWGEGLGNEGQRLGGEGDGANDKGAAGECFVASLLWLPFLFPFECAHFPSRLCHPSQDESETVLMIRELLGTRIRPAVQEDGGDIDFVDFDE
ncbi:unnamed protein product [Closterium sp. NIES-64]|nr:unnamed protein product [Closterium sp. NIES-64]